MTASLRAAVGRALAGQRVLLAVSGGLDSMVLLDAACAEDVDIAAVATFDHGTGPAATRAADLVASEAAARGLDLERGSASGPLSNEAAWRSARWRFLFEAAGRRRARVATAHTRDDQVETVLMRVLRGAGARGLAALYADGPVAHPLLDCSRSDVEAYARWRPVSWIEDPTNRSLVHLRNRVRWQLLPALAAVRPQLPHDLLALAQQAAELRRQVECFARMHVPLRVDRDGVSVARQALAGFGRPELALLWPAVAASAGVTLDRRGTERLTSFTIQGVPGARIQLAGGVEVIFHRDRFLFRRTARDARRRPAGRSLAGARRRLIDGLTLDGWRFSRGGAEEDLLWSAPLATDRPLWVRRWQPGDRMVPMGSDVPRRVKGLLRDAGVDAALRRVWPVVLAGEEIVWVPGVRRGRAATARSGRPATRYRCERID